MSQLKSVDVWVPNSLQICKICVRIFGAASLVLTAILAVGAVPPRRLAGDSLVVLAIFWLVSVLMLALVLYAQGRAKIFIDRRRGVLTMFGEELCNLRDIRAVGVEHAVYELDGSPAGQVFLLSLGLATQGVLPDGGVGEIQVEFVPIYQREAHATCQGMARQIGAALKVPLLDPCPKKLSLAKLREKGEDQEWAEFLPEARRVASPRVDC